MLTQKSINFFSTFFDSYKIKILMFKYNLGQLNTFVYHKALKPTFDTSFRLSTKGYSVVKMVLNVGIQDPIAHTNLIFSNK